MTDRRIADAIRTLGARATLLAYECDEQLREGSDDDSVHTAAHDVTDAIQTYEAIRAVESSAQEAKR